MAAQRAVEEQGRKASGRGNPLRRGRFFSSLLEALDPAELLTQVSTPRNRLHRDLLRDVNEMLLSGRVSKVMFRKMIHMT